MDEMKEILKDIKQTTRMKYNTWKLRRETARNEEIRLLKEKDELLNKLKSYEVANIKLRERNRKLSQSNKELREKLNDRDCERDINGDENKSSFQEGYNKVYLDEGTTDGICDEIQQSSVEGE